MSLDKLGTLFFIDRNGDVIRKIDPAGIITSITGNLPEGYSGDGSPLELAQFVAITGITADNAGNVYIVDAGNRLFEK